MHTEKFPYLTPEQLDALEGEAPATNEGVPDDVVLIEDAEELEPIEDPDFLDDPDAPPPEHDENLAERLEKAQLEEIASECLSWYDADYNSNKDWRELFTSGLDLLGVKIQDIEDPFPGACNAVHPVLLESVTKFQSKAYAELFPPQGPVRTKIMGTQTPAKQAQAKRVKDYMNYQIMEVMTEYGPELDRLLFYLAFAGSAFKKTYYDAALKRPKSIFLRVDDFVVNYGATDLASAARYTHKYTLSTNEIRKLVAAGVFREIDGLGEAGPEPNTDVQDQLDDLEGTSRTNFWDSDEHTIIEMHVDYDVPGDEDPDGIARPYIITIDHASQEVLAIRRNWREDDLDKKKIVWFTHYVMIPGFGFLGYGYLHLIGGLAKMATASMRQLSDAGTLVNLPAGFKSAMIRIVGSGGGFKPGEFKDVQTPLPDISKGFMPLPFKEPSPTLYNLLGFVTAAAQKFADSTEAVIADSTNYGPVGTTMALIEASGKMFSAIHKRLHFAQKHDLKLLAAINFDTLPEQAYPYDVVGGSREVFKADFDGRIDVCPVSDPNMASQSQKVALANTILTVSQQFPAVHDQQAVSLEMYHALGVEEPERLMAKPPPEPPNADPVTENFWALQGKPISVKIWEDHDSHVKVHMGVIKDPVYATTNAQAIQVLNGHVQHHMAYKYMVDMQQLIGELPQDGQIPPEQQNQIAMRAAQAADTLLERDVAIAQALEQGAGPTEIDVAMRGLDIQMEKHIMDFQAKMRELDLRAKDMAIDDVNADRDREVKLLIERMRIAHEKATKAVEVRKDVVLRKEANGRSGSGTGRS